MLLIMVFSCNVMFTHSKTFDEELESRIATARTLLKEYAAYFTSIEEAETFLEEKFDKTKTTMEGRVNNDMKNQESSFESFMKVREDGLPKRIESAWSEAEAQADKMKTTTNWYKKMRDYNVTEEYWIQNINNNLWRTNHANNYIKWLSDILDGIKEKGYTSMQTKAEQLKNGAQTPEQQAAKQEMINALKKEFHKLAQYAAATQFHEEEKQRSEGQSGIKQIRTRKGIKKSLFPLVSSNLSLNFHMTKIYAGGFPLFVLVYTLKGLLCTKVYPSKNMVSKV